jgi:predicted HTH transcriptional regulator
LESQHLEYKRQLTDELEREVVAFLNKEGGEIQIGINDDGTTHGVDAPDQVQLSLKNRLKNNIQPSIMGLFEILHEKKDSKDIIRLIIAGGLEKPYYLKKYGLTEKGCFLRVGSATEPMNKDLIESFYGKRVRNTIGRMDSPRTDLSFEQLRIYYDTKGLELNEHFMKNLELLTPENKPNYAAYLFADENGASFQIAKYAGSDRVDLIENRDYGRCSVIKAVKGMLDRVDVENTIFTKITSTNRKERELFNSVAMREALINAVVHNDYSYGAVPKLEFFSDRAEVTSMGGLPYGVTEADFFSGCSIPRNKEIMRIFRDLEMVEQLGSGVPRILKAYGKEAFEVRDSFIRITLPYSEPLHDSTLQATPQVTPQATPQVTPHVEKVLNSLENEMSRTELMEKLQLKDRKYFLQYYIEPCLQEGYIEMTLPEKPNSPKQKYRLTENGLNWKS